MNKGKKALNILGIIVSALLSIVLVLVLMVSPMVLSALSLLHPQTLVDTVTKVDMESTIVSIVEENGTEMDPQRVKMVSNLLATSAAKKLMKIYTQSVFDALGGKDTQGITEEMLREIVNEHEDEIVLAIRDSGGEFETLTDQELRDGIQKTADENAGEILEMLPDPQELKQDLVTENPQLELGIQLLVAVDTVKLTLVGVIVALCAVIFVCRLFDWRGFKWLAIDLLIAGVISAVICGGMGAAKNMAFGMIQENSLAGQLVDVLLGSVNNGLTLRTCVMLAAAVASLVVYIVICKVRKKKTAAAQAPTVEEPKETTEPNA